MKATQLLHNLGQSIWLDNITRDLLDTGTLKRYIDEFSVTGLTSNPTIFDHAIKNSAAYDAAIREKLAKGKSGEELFFELALEDLTRAADLFRPIYDRTNGVDGWVSLEVSPLLAYDTDSTLAAAKDLFARAERPNLFIKIPGTKEGLPAIEEAIFAGVPVNVTLLVLARAIRRRGRGVPARHRAAHRRRAQSQCRLGGIGLHQPLGRRGRGQGAGGAAQPARHRHRQAYLQGVPRLCSTRRAGSASYNAGARPQRLLWASTGTKDPTGVGHPVCQGAGRAVHGEHHAGSHVEGPRGARASSARSCRRTAATAKKCWRSSPRPASTSMRWPPSSRRKAPSRSSNPGTN